MMNVKPAPAIALLMILSLLIWGVLLSLANEDIEKPEPNEPMKYSLPIPTWPDYIELEKDLILRFDFPEPNNLLMKLIHEPTAYKIFSKGTKIYFKEDE